MTPRSVQVWFQNRRQRTKPGYAPPAQSKAARALLGMIGPAASSNSGPNHEKAQSAKEQSSSQSKKPPEPTAPGVSDVGMTPTVDPTPATRCDTSRSSTSSKTNTPPPEHEPSLQQHESSLVQPRPQQQPYSQPPVYRQAPHCPQYAHVAQYTQLPPKALIRAPGDLQRHQVPPMQSPLLNPQAAPPAQVPSRRAAGLDWKQPKLLGPSGISQAMVSAASLPSAHPSMISTGYPYGHPPPPPPGVYNAAWPPLGYQPRHPPLTPQSSNESSPRSAPAPQPPYQTPRHHSGAAPPAGAALADALYAPRCTASASSSSCSSVYRSFEPTAPAPGYYARRSAPVDEGAAAVSSAAAVAAAAPSYDVAPGAPPAQSSGAVEAAPVLTTDTPTPPSEPSVEAASTAADDAVLMLCSLAQER